VLPFAMTLHQLLAGILAFPLHQPVVRWLDRSGDGRWRSAGTFDPVTNGHIDVMERSLRLFDRVTSASGNISKSVLFSDQERLI
jgi:cytidyltransferase-like protein